VNPIRFSRNGSRKKCQACLPKDYHVARPRGILASTSTNATVIASPRRLSTWNGGQSNDISRPPLHAGERQWWRIEPSLVIWLRLTPHAGELRGSVFSGIHDRRFQRSSPLTWAILKSLPTGNCSSRANKTTTTRTPLGNVDLESDDIAGEWRWRLVRSHLFGRFQICQVHGTAGARTGKTPIPCDPTAKTIPRISTPASNDHSCSLLFS
jgi:hypothetical protein